MCKQGSTWVDGKNGYNTENEINGTSLFTSVNRCRQTASFLTKSYTFSFGYHLYTTENESKYLLALQDIQSRRKRDQF
ncbi:hypothetical protein Q9233_001272 [Columba guinea]|nr:hypothetical protein Q9233_001272 [Columba guinea]